jgi:hypothetical protein
LDEVSRQGFLKTVRRAVPDDKDCQNIAKRFVDFAKEYFLFIDADIPPTNNLAEQVIRGVAIARKITQGSRIDWGNACGVTFWASFGECCKRVSSRNIVLCRSCRIAFKLSRQAANAESRQPLKTSKQFNHGVHREH